MATGRFCPDPSLAPDPLFASVLARRTAKEPFDTTREVPRGIIDLARSAAAHGNRVDGSGEPDSVGTLRTLTTEALDIEIETPYTYQESVDLFRIGKGEIEENPDGIDFSGRLFEAMAGLGLFDRESATDRSSSAFRQGREAVLANTRTAMAHLWVVSATNTRVDQLDAGRDWMRIHLATTSAGVALHPISQALQEYPETARSPSPPARTATSHRHASASRPSRLVSRDRGYCAFRSPGCS